MSFPLADRVGRLGTESAFDVLVRARALEAQGRSVIHLEIGEPDFDSPAHVIEAGVKALRDGQTHYGPPAGLPVLREAIASSVSASRGISVKPDQVVVTPGAKPVMFFTVLAALNAGDEAIIPDPGFPIYQSLVDFVGAKAVPIQLHERLGFRLDPAELAARITDRTRLLILNSPHNPCGGMLTQVDLALVADAVRGKPILVLSDEIYGRMSYGPVQHSIASEPGLADQTVILDGFSKTYAMTGWRLGYGVFPGELASKIALLMTNSNSCTATFTQLAGVAALTGPQTAVDAMMAQFVRRRNVVVEGLNALPGWSCLWPDGAFYAFPNVQAFGRGSDWLADYFLNEAGVALLNGGSFGTAGRGYLRLSYASSETNLQEALARLRIASIKLLDLRA